MRSANTGKPATRRQLCRFAADINLVSLTLVSAHLPAYALASVSLTDKGCSTQHLRKEGGGGV